MITFPKVEKVTAYRCSDEEVYPELSEALLHQKYLNFEKRYTENALFGNDSYVEAADFWDYLFNNRTWLLKILEAKSLPNHKE